MATILEKVQGCLASVYAGDMLGMPWEMKTPEQILQDTDGKGVRGLSEPKERYFHSMRGLELGMATDDWQFTRAIARSIIDCQGYSYEHLVKKHLEEFEKSRRGWGRGTKGSIKEIKKFFESNGQEGRDPNKHLLLPEPGSGLGAGNGVAMKIAPVALFNALKHHGEPARYYEELLDQVMQLSSMTHSDPRAGLSAFAVSLVIGKVIFEPMTDIDKQFVEIVDFFAQHLRFAELEYPFSGEESFYQKLLRIFEFKMLDDPKKLRQEIGTGCYCMESVPFSIATFLRHPTDFRSGVLEAINAGGDTDTTAAMVGAMIGANAGIEVIPEEWVNEEAIEFGRQLYDVASSTQ